MMAVDLHNCELLPSSDQFFTPQDHLDGLSRDDNNKPINKNASYLFGSFDSGSEFSSPMGSELSSSSTESSEEDDDYIGELTRQMAQYMLQDEDKHEKAWGLSCSPETRLCSQLCSNLDGPAGLSREPSPPLTPVIRNFEKMMMINEESARHDQGERFTSTSTSIQSSWGSPNVGFPSKQALIDDQIRAIRFQRLKQEQAMNRMGQKPRTKHYQSKGRILGGFNNGQKVSPNSNNPCCNLQQQQQINQQAGSDMRAVFLNASRSRNGSCGTGVFLPRRTATTPFESRKKQGCATVLIPARVVQALKLHFEQTGVPSRLNNGFPLEHDACASGRNSMYSQQKRQSKTVPAVNHQEMGLPQEWTY